jgi:hypothetical protein
MKSDPNSYLPTRSEGLKGLLGDSFGAGGLLFYHGKIPQLIRITNVSVLAEATAVIHGSDICFFQLMLRRSREKDADTEV